MTLLWLRLGLVFYLLLYFHLFSKISIFNFALSIHSGRPSWENRFCLRRMQKKYCVSPVMAGTVAATLKHSFRYHAPSALMTGSTNTRLVQPSFDTISDLLKVGLVRTSRSASKSLFFVVPTVVLEIYWKYGTTVKIFSSENMKSTADSGNLSLEFQSYLLYFHIYYHFRFWQPYWFPIIYQSRLFGNTSFKLRIN